METDSLSKGSDELIQQLEEKASEHGVVIYDILRRNAGWGIHWFEESRLPQSHEESPRQPDYRFKEGLVVYQYYPTLSACLNAELERLSKRETH